MTKSSLRERLLALFSGAKQLQVGWPQLYLLVASAALAAATYSTAGDIWDSLMAFGAVWVTAGLAIQAAEIWQAFSSRAGLLSAERFTWRFEAVWRLAVAMLLPLYFLLRDPEELPTEVGPRTPESTSAILLFVAFGAMLITALSGNCRLPARTARHDRRQKAGDVGAGILTAVLVLFVGWQIVSPASLRQVVSGFNKSAESGPSLRATQLEFFLRAAAASSAALVAILIARTLGRQTRFRGPVLAVYASVVVGCLAFAAQRVAGLSREGAALANLTHDGAAGSWSLATVGSLSCLLLVATTALAWRFTAKRGSNGSGPLNVWRLHPQHYYHETRWLAAFFVLASLGQLWILLEPAFHISPQSYADWLTQLSQRKVEMGQQLLQPATVLLTAIFLVALRGMLGRQIPEPAVAQATFDTLPPVRFAFGWTTLLAALALGAAAVGWLGFSIGSPGW